MHDGNPRTGPTGWAPWRLPLALTAAALLLVGTVVVGAAVWGTGSSGRGHAVDPAGQAAHGTGPLDLHTIEAAVAAHYRAAEAHTAAYAGVPCYCGCEDFLGHRNLADCFLLPDGAGYEPHAAGCGVCIAESVLVRELVADGAAGPTIRDAVVARFGATPPTVPPPAPT